MTEKLKAGGELIYNRNYMMYAAKKIGDKVDIAMLDCQIALLENPIIRYVMTGQLPKPIGNRHPSITPFEALPSQDGYVIVCVGNEKLWNSFCQVIEHPELAEDERFSNNVLRNKNVKELSAILGKITQTKTTKEWIVKFEQAGVPCGPVNNVADILEDEQVKARKMLITLEHEKVGKLQVAGCPIKSSQLSEANICKFAPFLGQDNEEIFTSLGLTKDEIKKLQEENVL